MTCRMAVNTEEGGYGIPLLLMDLVSVFVVSSLSVCWKHCRDAMLRCTTEACCQQSDSAFKYAL